MASDTEFSGTHVLLVGGSSGIGVGIAQAFCNRGAYVCVWGTGTGPSHYDGSDASYLSVPGYSCVT